MTKSLEEKNRIAFCLFAKASLDNTKRLKDPVGKTRIKLAKIISECLGVNCQPEDLRAAKGASRTNKTLDVYCWEVFAKHPNGLPFWAGCFDTMTDCVKAGKVVLYKGEIYAFASGQ